MAKFYYNDVLLPEIPAGLTDRCPYLIIKVYGTKYSLYAGANKWYVRNNTITQSEGYLEWYDAYTSDDEWTLNRTLESSTLAASVGDGVVWANNDVPSSSATSTTIYFYGSDPVPESGSEPSEPEADTLYTVNGSSLTAVADAIRGKTGTTSELAFPDGYVSAVNDISSVSDLSNAKDIAFDGDETGGRYIIEDETITPLFNQVKRITETEDAMTFEGATESLLNVTVGGSLPNAEEASFGDNDASVETGIITLGTLSKIAVSDTAYAFNKYTANEAFAIIGLRIYDTYRTNSRYLRLWNANGEMVRETAQITPTLNTWTMAYFDEPVNIAKGESFIVSASGVRNATTCTISDTTFNGKVTCDGGDWMDSSSAFPSGFSTTKIYGVVDFIIGTVSAELPDEYQIARTTMDDIANEVKRITGTTGKMTTAQMLTALQSIQLQDKSVTPTAEVQTITPDDGYFALSSVTVGAITEENEAVTEIVNEKMEVVANDTY